MHGLIFETSVCYWQNQPGCYLSSCPIKSEKRRLPQSFIKMKAAAGEEHSNTPITAKQIIHTITGLFPSESNSAYGRPQPSITDRHTPPCTNPIMPSFHFNPDRTDSCTRSETRHRIHTPRDHVRCATLHSKARTLQGNTGDHSHSRHSSDDLAWTAPQTALLMQDHSQLSAQTILLRFDSLFFHSYSEKKPSKNNSTTLPKKNGSDCTP